MRRQPLAAELRSARKTTDHLFDLVHERFLYERPIDRRHRLVFYLGHVDAFDWNHVARFGMSEPSFEPALDELFSAGIDPDSDGLPRDQASDWPSLAQIRDYVRRLRSRMDQIVLSAPEELVHMAIEHRLMHAETLAYVLHAMPFEAKKSPTGIRSHSNGRRVVNSMIRIPGGCATLGRRRADGFGWDNEFEAHAVEVREFEIQRHKVTNGQYLEFVRDGGPVPPFWVESDGRWFYRGMFQCIPLPLDQPVYVTWNDASAYAQWRGLALPTEAQFHRAAYGAGNGHEREYPWGDAEPGPDRGNFDFAHWDPVPVDACADGNSAFGVAQLVGNGWEWTSTVFAPFEGFAPAPNYPGYSQNFFDGDHYVMKGGSPRTAARLLRRSFRNWFRPDYPYVYASFRCVQS